MDKPDTLIANMNGEAVKKKLSFRNALQVL